MRVVPRQCEEINETWIADRDRFSYEGSTARTGCCSRSVRASRWQLARTPTGTRRSPRRPRASRRRRGGADGLGLLAHPSSTLEELYLLTRLAEGPGSATTSIIACVSGISVDQRRRDRCRRSGSPIADVDQLDALLIVGSNLRPELPMLAHRVRKAALRGAKRQLAAACRIRISVPRGTVSDGGAPAQMVAALAAVLRAALTANQKPAQSSLASLLAGAAVSDAIAPSPNRSGTGRRAIWLGALALRTRAFASCVRWRASWRAPRARASANWPKAAMPPGPTWPACCRIGARRAARAKAGLNAREMLEKPRRGYLLLGTEPWADSAQPEALPTLAESRAVVAVTAFASPAMLEAAQVLLPAGALPRLRAPT